MALFGLFGNDKAMAATTYTGQPSASETAARKRRARYKASAKATSRAGQAWEDAEFERLDGRGRRGRWGR